MFDKADQLDFSGGVNLTDDPSNLKDTELVDSVNVRVVGKNKVQQRLGYTQYNSSAIGASAEIRALSQFEGYDGAFLPVCQVDDNKIYKGDTAFPGTGGAWSAAYTQTAGSSVMSADAMWGKLVIVNGVDSPLVWEGNYGKVAGCKKTVDNAATYIDYTTEAGDADLTTEVKVDALDTAANGDWLLVASYVPKLTGFYITMDGTNVNTNASVLAVHYWDGDSWEAVSGLSDGTINVATKTLGKSAAVSFTEATTTLQSIDNAYLYWWRISVDAALSATVRIDSIRLIYNMQTMQNIWDGGYFRPVGFKTTIDTSVTLKDYTLAVTDNSLSTFASVGGMTVTTGAIYVQSAKKFRGLRIKMSTTNVNTNAVTLTATYWNGSAFASLTIVDGTSANSKTFAQTGFVTFAWPTAFEKRRLSVDEIPTYQIQLLVGAALSATVEILEVELMEFFDSIRPHELCIFHKNRLFLLNRPDHPNFLFYSAEFGPEVFNGEDSGYIGVPSGHEITAVARFFNELFIATPDEIYLLEGSSPLTFGLLKINTGGIGVAAKHSVVAVGKHIYFFHATGFYRFDGVGVTNLSADKIPHFFDDTQTSYFIPTSRYVHVQGRFDRVHNTVEWTVSKGSTQATNNCIVIFDVVTESFYFDNIVAASLLKTISSSFQDLVYHGGYVGKAYRDQNGTTDAGTTITSYITTRGFVPAEQKGEQVVFRGAKLQVKSETATSLTVTYAMNGNSSLSTFFSPSLISTTSSCQWKDEYVVGPGTFAQLKILHSTSGATFTLYGITMFFQPARKTVPGV